MLSAESFMTLWFLMVWLLMAAYALLLVSSWNRLRQRHPEKWEELGRPGVWNVNPKVLFSSRRFLWSPEVLALGDEVLSQRAKLSRLLAGASALLFLAFAAFIVWAVLQSQ